MCHIHYAYCIIYGMYPINFYYMHLILHILNILKLHRLSIAVTVTTEISHSNYEFSLVTRESYVLK